MKTIEESVVTAMDGSDTDLYPYLPYILQDIWEIGSSPEIIIDLIKKHAKNYSNLKLLDLGCGKGAVSIKIAEQLGCYCYGIDAIEAFIKEAKTKAKQCRVKKLCYFEVGDIRTRITDMSDFDIILLGSIGPVFGDFYETLSILKKSLKQTGFIIIDDGYIEDGSNYSHPLMEQKSILLKQIANAGMCLIDEAIAHRDQIKESDDYIFEKLNKRCFELIEQQPEKSKLFLDYINKQQQENEVLEQKVVCSAMVIK